MTLNDVADRLLAVPHHTVFVCLHSKNAHGRLWFQSNLRDCLTERGARLGSPKGSYMTVITPTGREVNLSVTHQDALVSDPRIFKGYIPSTPIFTEYRGGWAESTIGNAPINP